MPQNTRRVELDSPTRSAEQKPPRRATGPILSSEDFAELAESLPKFLTPKDLAELYGLGHDAANLLAHEIGVIRFGTKNKLLKVPRSAVLRDLQRRAALSTDTDS
jgi:hypothetical protein